jgi:hypothetical protein
LTDTLLEERRILQAKGVRAERRHWISPQRLGGMSMPIGGVEIEGHFYNFATGALPRPIKPRRGDCAV